MSKLDTISDGPVKTGVEVGRPSVTKNTSPRIALVCDWLTTPGGAEKVLLELHHMYPDAPIYTSQYSKRGINWFNDADVRTGWLQIFPKSLRKFLGPLRQLYFSHLDLSNYDLVISVTGAEAKSVRTKPHPKKIKQSSSSLPSEEETGARHLCYCHVPTQYYWQMYDQYIEHPGFGILDPLVRLIFKLLVKPLRQADFRAAQQPDQFITISAHAQDQIQRYYHRNSAIIYPPVDIAKFSGIPQGYPPRNLTLSTKAQSLSTDNPPEIHRDNTTYPQKARLFPQLFHKKSTSAHNFSTTFPQLNPDFSTGYYIISCRQVTWKRVDLAIEACRQLHLPLLVVGDGPEHSALVQLAENAPNIQFIPWIETRELAQLLQNAKAYLFPSLEPFGIAAVEALAAGCPVIAYRKGGSQDFITSDNGIFFDQQTPESLVEALRKFQHLHFDRQKISASATKFSPDHFRSQIEDLIKKGNL